MRRCVSSQHPNPTPAGACNHRLPHTSPLRSRALAFETVARRKGRLLDEVHDWGQSLRENPDLAIRNRFNQREAMLECQASMTIALGYRDLKPAVVGACGLPGTELEGRYERLLHDLRSNWTDTLGKQALQAVAALRQRIDTLEADLSRDIPQFASTLRPARLEDIRARLQPDEMLIEFVAYANRYGAFLLARTRDLRWADLGPASAISRCGISSLRSTIGAFPWLAKRPPARKRQSKPRRTLCARFRKN